MSALRIASQEEDMTDVIESVGALEVNFRYKPKPDLLSCSV